jgi:hypothetical protein
MQQDKKEKSRDAPHCLLLRQLATPHWHRYSVGVMWERLVQSVGEGSRLYTLKVVRRFNDNLLTF